MKRWQLLIAAVVVWAAMPVAAHAGHLAGSGHGLTSASSHHGSASAGAIQPGGLAANHANITPAGTVHQHDAHAQQFSSASQTAAHALARPAPSDLLIGLPSTGHPTIMLVGNGQHSNSTAPKSQTGSGMPSSGMGNQGSGGQSSHTTPVHPAVVQTGGPTRSQGPQTNPPANASGGGAMVSLVGFSGSGSGSSSRNLPPVTFAAGTSSLTTNHKSATINSIVIIPKGSGTANSIARANHGPIVIAHNAGTSLAVAPVPEPGSILIFGAALAGLMLWKRRTVFSV